MATAWAFNKVDDNTAIGLLYESVKSGKSRFGWSKDDANNLKLKDNWTDCHSKQLFLLDIKPRDWIVHINMPEWGKCVAAQVISGYNFDEGIEFEWGKDYRHCFDVDVNTVIEFDRKDPNVLPTVNLKPRQRYHRVYAFDDFIQSIENLKNNKVHLNDSESSGEYHLRDQTNAYLSGITSNIHETHKSKNLERFLAKVFRKIPGVIDVKENGFGWGTDHGADIIVTISNSLGNLCLEHKIIVQVKSYKGDHSDLDAVNQVKEGIKKYSGTAGMIITTAESTEALENEVNKVSEELGVPIDLLAADDVAKFVIKHAPDLVFNLDGLA